MRNVRRFFRLDITVPAVIKLADKDEMVRLVLPELTGGLWQKNEDAFARSMVDCHQALSSEHDAAGRIVIDLSLRVQLLVDSILCLVQGFSAEDSIENYALNRKKVALTSHLKSGNGVAADMLRAFNEKVEFYFSLVDLAFSKRYAEFLLAIEHSRFSFDAYLDDLQLKAAGGSVLAQCLVDMNNQLGRHVAFLVKFRQEAIYIVDQTAWPLRKLNLSAGGVGFLSQDPYPKFARLKIDFRLGHGAHEMVFNMAGNIVSSRHVSENEYYTAVEFTNASEAIQQQIIMYLQDEELNQTIAMLKKLKHEVADVNLDQVM